MMEYSGDPLYEQLEGHCEHRVELVRTEDDEITLYCADCDYSILNLEKFPKEEKEENEN